VGEAAEKPTSTIVASGGTSGADPFPTLAPGEAASPTPTADLPLAPTVPPRVKAAPTAIVIAERVPPATKSPTPTATPRPSPSPSPSPSPTATKKETATPTPKDVPRETASPSPSPSPASSPSPTSPSRESREARAATSTPAPPRPNRNGEISLARQLGLSARTIVIDAGHGGHDTGAIGHGGLNEKDLVLDVALRVAKLVRSELGAEVLMTRDDDVFIPLPERTAIANSRNADLFLSIHANSSHNRTASGIETYYLSTARTHDAEALAQRENAMSPGTIGDLQGLVKAIKDSKVEESRDFASSVQEGMLTLLKPYNPLVNDRGVRTAPFYVLIGANMPSILAEIAFVSNPQEERLLRTSDYKDKIARSLLAGVKTYLEILNRVPIQQLTSLSRRPTVGPKTRELPNLDRKGKGRKETRR
jgi:N-acetylmuramoyl-L-alanine amidase